MTFGQAKKNQDAEGKAKMADMGWVLWMEKGGPRTGPEDREVGMRRATEGHDTHRVNRRFVAGLVWS